MTATAHESERIAVRPATPERWDDVVQVFESGAIANRCWCQWVRKTQQQARDDGSDGNRASLRVLIEDRKTPGVIAYQQGEPVGWCSVGSKGSFGRLSRSQALTPSDADPSPDGTWATLCFYVAPSHRGGGVARSLLQGALAYARQMGATAYEAYPVRTEGRKLNNDSAYPGTDQMLADEGFHEIPGASSRRSSQIIMRRLL
jgi:ribosomal protein S18 acetylase RimI-like enzyme